MFLFRRMKRNWWKPPRITLRSVLQRTHVVPTISLDEKVVEAPDIQTRGKTQQGVQMTKHVPLMQVVEKTVEGAQLQIIEKIDETSKIQMVQGHFAVLAQLASRTSAILKFGDEIGEDPLLKVGTDPPGHIGAAEQESIGRER